MSLVKILVVGDNHFKENNADQSNEFTSAFLDLATKLQPDLIVNLGDTLDTHERYSEGPFNRAIAFLDKLRGIAPTFLLIGNHDLINNTQFLSERHAFNALKKWKNITIVDKPSEHRILNTHLSFVFTPYVPNGRLKEALDGSGLEWENATAIFCHQEIKGIKMNSVASTTGDVWEEGLPLLVSGHIHDEQCLKNGKSIPFEKCYKPQEDKYPDVVYTGSAMQHSFGEMTKKHVYLFTFRDDSTSLESLDEPNPQMERFDLGLKLKKNLYYDIGEIDDFKPEEFEQYYVKISVTGSTAECKEFRKSEKYKELEGRGVKFCFTKTQEEAKHILEDIKKKYGKEDKLYDYLDILRSLISKEKDKQLRRDYEELTQEHLSPIGSPMSSPASSPPEKKIKKVAPPKKIQPPVVQAPSPTPSEKEFDEISKAAKTVDFKTVLSKKEGEKLFAIKGKDSVTFRVVPFPKEKPSPSEKEEESPASSVSSKMSAPSSASSKKSVSSKKSSVSSKSSKSSKKSKQESSEESDE